MATLQTQPEDAGIPGKLVDASKTPVGTQVDAPGRTVPAAPHTDSLAAGALRMTVDPDPGPNGV